MILIMLGTQNNSFHRLLEKVEKCIDLGIIKEDVIVQAGSTKFKSNHMKILNLIPYKELEELIKRASLVITHGGVGSIVMCLKFRKKVIVVPRLEMYKEHVNDHQIQIVENFDKQGFIKGVVDLDKLEYTIKEIEKFEPKEFKSGSGNIISIVENFIDNN